MLTVCPIHGKKAINMSYHCILVREEGFSLMGRREGKDQLIFVYFTV